jgi:phosphotransferase system enzyme I (PtsI)
MSKLPTEFQAVRDFGACGWDCFVPSFSCRVRVDELGGRAVRSLQVAREAAGEYGAIVRLFDVGGEFGPTEGARTQSGARLARGSFQSAHKQIMRTQVRAILRARGGPLSLVIPMIADVGDVRLAKRVIEEEGERLASENVTFATVKIGAMIEVPSAVLTADKIASEVDFFELGTNDLVQYTLAVDRGNDKVSDWFRTLHPAVALRISRTVEAAKNARIPVIGLW